MVFQKHAEWKFRQKAKMLSDKLGIDQKINGKLYIDLQALNDDLALLRQEQVFSHIARHEAFAVHVCAPSSHLISASSAAEGLPRLFK